MLLTLIRYISAEWVSFALKSFLDQFNQDTISKTKSISSLLSFLKCFQLSAFFTVKFCHSLLDFWSSLLEPLVFLIRTFRIAYMRSWADRKYRQWKAYGIAPFNLNIDVKFGIIRKKGNTEIQKQDRKYDYTWNFAIKTPSLGVLKLKSTRCTNMIENPFYLPLLITIKFCSLFNRTRRGREEVKTSEEIVSEIFS